VKRLQIRKISSFSPSLTLSVEDMTDAHLIITGAAFTGLPASRRIEEFYLA
jgi:hypothetical protein